MIRGVKFKVDLHDVASSDLASKLEHAKLELDTEQSHDPSELLFESMHRVFFTCNGVAGHLWGAVCNQTQMHVTRLVSVLAYCECISLLSASF